MCQDVEINESQITNILKKTNSFIMIDEILILKNGQQNTLATFKKMEIEEPITEKYWKLKQLGSKDIRMVENQEREIFLTLKSNDQRITGFAGCNSLNGEYTLEEGNKIKFNNIAVTMMAHPDVAFNESEFLKVFEFADNYTVKDDVLPLHIGKKAPIAVFEAVYFD
jgi:heat shock protein HslJ